MLAAAYSGQSQRIRVMSEAWAHRELFCPACGHAQMQRSEPNRHALDFQCPACSENFELKSKAGVLGNSIVDGVHKTMMERLGSNTNPSLLVLNYNRTGMKVSGLMLVPRHFFTTDMIAKKNPTPPHARRPNWVGCTIRLAGFPMAGKITLVLRGVAVPAAQVLAQRKSCVFLANQRAEARGWLLDVLQCIERIGVTEFALADLYRFEHELSQKYPKNNNVRAKVRQQTQVLRDHGILEFVEKSRYRRIDPQPSAA